MAQRLAVKKLTQSTINKILLIKEAKGLELQTENYADEFRLSAYYGDVVTKIIRVKNVGEEELNLIISCDGEFCNNVVLNTYVPFLFETAELLDKEFDKMGVDKTFEKLKDAFDRIAPC